MIQHTARTAPSRSSICPVLCPVPCLVTLWGQGQYGSVVKSMWTLTIENLGLPSNSEAPAPPPASLAPPPLPPPRAAAPCVTSRDPAPRAPRDLLPAQWHVNLHFCVIRHALVSGKCQRGFAVDLILFIEDGDALELAPARFCTFHFSHFSRAAHRCLCARWFGQLILIDGIHFAQVKPGGLPGEAGQPALPAPEGSRRVVQGGWPGPVGPKSHNVLLLECGLESLAPLPHRLLLP